MISKFVFTWKCYQNADWTLEKVYLKGVIRKSCKEGRKLLSIFPCLFFVIKLCSSDRGYKRAYHIWPGTETLKIFPSVQFTEPTFQDKLSSSKKTFLKSTDLHESFIILSKICYGNEKKKKPFNRTYFFFLSFSQDFLFLLSFSSLLFLQGLFLWDSQQTWFPNIPQ